MAKFELNFNKKDMDVILKNFDKTITITNEELVVAINESTDHLFAKVKQSVSSSVHFATTLGKKEENPLAFTGLEVGNIGIVSNKLNESVKRIVSFDSSGATGEIGWFDSESGPVPTQAVSLGINWPDSTDISIASEVTDIGSDFEVNNEPLISYLTNVIVGSGRIRGRNVLRMALVEDIVGSRTLNTIANKLKRLF